MISFATKMKHHTKSVQNNPQWFRQEEKKNNKINSECWVDIQQRKKKWKKQRKSMISFENSDLKWCFIQI